MKRKKCNFKKAREYSIEKALANLGHFPSKKSEKEAWYLSPFRTSETQASFKVSLVLNRWYDHGMGKGGNVIDLLMQLKNYTVTQVLDFLDSNKIDFSFHQPEKLIKAKSDKNYKIKEVKQLNNYALVSYLKQRCINIDIAKKHCNDVHYDMNNKPYFSIGFKNDLGGYEIRNRYSKMCLGKKAITTIKNNSTVVVLFEGWIDFLSYLSCFKTVNPNEDFIILNSTALHEKLKGKIENYEKVWCVFDNDTSGEKTTNYVKSLIVPNAFFDMRKMYSEHKDYNDYWIAMNDKRDV